MAFFHKIIIVVISLIGLTTASPIPHLDSSKKNEAVEAKSASVTTSAAEASFAQADTDIGPPSSSRQNKAPASRADWYDRSDDYPSRRERDYGGWRERDYGGWRDRGDSYYPRDRDYYYGGGGGGGGRGGGFRTTYSQGDNFMNSLGWTLLNQQSELSDLGMQLGNRNFRTWNSPRYGGGYGRGGYGGGGYGGGWDDWYGGYGRW